MAAIEEPKEARAKSIHADLGSYSGSRPDLPPWFTRTSQRDFRTGFREPCLRLAGPALRVATQCGNWHELACTARHGRKASSRSRIVAAILAFLLGGIGVHKFYLGQIGWGILYLVFCWTFIPAIIAFVEFVILICMSDETFARRFA